MKSQRPYLLRAIYDWIQDSGEVPYLLVDASVDGVVVPPEHIQDNQIVLNVSSTAVRDLNLGDEFVMFSSRFNGLAMEIVLPVHSIKAIYCRDSGEGMAFTEDVAGTAFKRSSASDQGADKESAKPASTPAASAPGSEKLERSDGEPAKPSGKQKPTLKLV